MLVSSKQINGIVYSKQRTTSSDTSVNANENGLILTVSTAGGDRIATLPLIPTVGEGFITTIRKDDTVTGVVTVNPSGADVIAGPAPRQIVNNREAITLVSDGVSKWIVVSEFNAGLTAAGSVFTSDIGISTTNSSGGPGAGITNTTFLSIGALPFSRSNYLISGASPSYEIIYLAYLDAGATGEIRAYNVTTGATVTGSLQALSNSTIQEFILPISAAELPTGADNILEIQGRKVSGGGAARLYLQYGGIRIKNIMA